MWALQPEQPCGIDAENDVRRKRGQEPAGGVCLSESPPIHRGRGDVRWERVSACERAEHAELRRSAGLGQHLRDERSPARRITQRGRARVESSGRDTLRTLGDEHVADRAPYVVRTSTRARRREHPGLATELLVVAARFHQSLDRVVRRHRLDGRARRPRRADRLVAITSTRDDERRARREQDHDLLQLHGARSSLRRGAIVMPGATSLRGTEAPAARARPAP